MSITALADGAGAANSSPTSSGVEVRNAKTIQNRHHEVVGDTPIEWKQDVKALSASIEANTQNIIRLQGGALHQLARDNAEVMEAYARARTATLDGERWRKIAVEDLERHRTCHPEAAPIDADFIAAVAALGHEDGAAQSS